MTYDFKGTHSVYKDSYFLTVSVLLRLLLDIFKTDRLTFTVTRVARGLIRIYNTKHGLSSFRVQFMVKDHQ